MSFINQNQDIRKLFVVCNQLRENTVKVETSLQELYKISLRSSICASHVESGKQAFNEISKNIAKCSKAMEAELLQIKNLGTELTNLSLSCLKRFHQARRVYEAGLLGCGDNTALVNAAVNQIQETIKLNSNLIDRGCQKILEIGERMALHQDKLWNLSIHLKMEASYSDNEDQLFFQIAESIARAGEELEVQMETYVGLVAECRNILRSVRGISAGEVHRAA